jgi:hypothetical protein
VLVAEDRFSPVGGAFFLLGIVFGFLTAIAANFDLTQTWLLIAYGRSLFILVNGLTYHRRLAEKLKAAASPDDRASGEIRAIAGGPALLR